MTQFLPRKVHGYTDFGPVRNPPLPIFIIMTDRDDGTEWVLTHDLAGDYVAINDVLPDGKHTLEVVRYGPFEGPYVPDCPRCRLFIRGGRIGYEIAELSDAPEEINQQAIATRRGEQRIVRTIIRPSDWVAFPDELAFSEILG